MTHSSWSIMGRCMPQTPLDLLLRHFYRFFSSSFTWLLLNESAEAILFAHLLLFIYVRVKIIPPASFQSLRTLFARLIFGCYCFLVSRNFADYFAYSITLHYTVSVFECARVFCLPTAHLTQQTPNAYYLHTWVCKMSCEVHCCALVHIVKRTEMFVSIEDILPLFSP